MSRSSPPYQKDKFLRSSGILPEWALRPSFIDFHRLRVTGPYEYPLHQHSSYEVIVVEKGPYACLLNGEELTLPPGHLLVIKPGDWHQDHLRRGQRHYVLHFSLGGEAAPGAAPVDFFAAGIRPAQQKAVAAGLEERALFGILEREAQRADAYSAGLQDAALEMLFWRLVRCFPADRVSARFRRRTREQAFVGRLGQAVEERLAGPLTVGDLARRLGMSRRTLTLNCRRLLNDSPAHLIARRKIDEAVRLLAHTERTVKEVSYLLGFENPYHFSRVFKRYRGCPPSALRA